MDHCLTINFKQSPKFLHTTIRGDNYDEEKQRCTVLFTPGQTSNHCHLLKIWILMIMIYVMIMIMIK